VLTADAPVDRATALSIFRHLCASPAPSRRVRRLEFADLPETISGKIRRVALRRTEAVNANAGIRADGEFRAGDFPELAAR
jgi:acetyl-CoA synthetase